MGRREDQNILELKVDKILTDNTAVIKDLEMGELIIIVIKRVNLSGALNFPSPRFSFFLNLALLGSPSRTVKVF